jgi:hypothetical protein
LPHPDGLMNVAPVLSSLKMGLYKPTNLQKSARENEKLKKENLLDHYAHN